MPATPTTPVNAAVDTFYKPTSDYSIVSPPTGRSRLSTPVATVSRVLHYQSGIAVRRYDGTAWITMYVPRF